MKHYRVDSIAVQIVVTELNEQGQPIDEHIMTPTRLFRAKCPDAWATVDDIAEKAIQKDGR